MFFGLVWFGQCTFDPLFVDPVGSLNKKTKQEKSGSPLRRGDTLCLK